MCGIAGYLGDLPADLADSAVARMCQAMLHRGPNGSGFFASGQAHLGMRRLSVIDLATGDQPLFSPCGQVAVFMNGEIYNYREIRRKYQAQGYPFTSQSDTEVILPLYLEYGRDFANHLNGMFAIALYDGRDRSLCLARDELGIKPLFYRQAPQGFFFASELGALLAGLGETPPLDSSALDLYFTLGYFPSPLSAYQGVRRFPAGQIAVVRDASSLTFHPYRGFAFTPQKFTEKEWIAKLGQAIKRCVQTQLVSDVPVGIFLGGGLDSAAIALAATQSSGHRLYGVNVAFDDPDFDETREAKLVADICGIDLEVATLTPKLLSDMLPARITFLAEPFTSWANCSIQLAAKVAHQNVTVALTGAGGDELFGGYPTLTAHKALALAGPAAGLLLSLALRPFPNLPLLSRRANLASVVKAMRASLALPPEQGYLLFKQAVDEPGKAALYRSDFRARLAGEGLGQVVDRVLEQIPANTQTIDRLLWLDTSLFLGNCVLHSFDHATMAESIEARVPLLDQELVALALTMPHQLKHRFWSTKYILRKALGDFLPPRLVNLPKRGFSMPLAKWMRSGPIHDLLQDLLTSRLAREDEILQVEAVRSLLDAHLSGHEDHSRALATLGSYYLWRASLAGAGSPFRADERAISASKKA